MTWHLLVRDSQILIQNRDTTLTSAVHSEHASPTTIRNADADINIKPKLHMMSPGNGVAS